MQKLKDIVAKWWHFGLYLTVEGLKGQFVRYGHKNSTTHLLSSSSSLLWNVDELNQLIYSSKTNNNKQTIENKQQKTK